MTRLQFTFGGQDTVKKSAEDTDIWKTMDPWKEGRSATPAAPDCLQPPLRKRQPPKSFGDFFVLRRISLGGARSERQSPTSSATDRVISPNSEDWPRLDLGSTSRIKQLGTDTGSRLFLIGPRSGRGRDWAPDITTRSKWPANGGGWRGRRPLRFDITL